ncbi:MAG: hypothetical protein SFY32_09585 [Bacteroidota bacterium]|nr:hypothetical protein [Bacteroidota bacterium]
MKNIISIFLISCLLLNCKKSDDVNPNSIINLKNSNKIIVDFQAQPYFKPNKTYKYLITDSLVTSEYSPAIKDNIIVKVEVTYDTCILKTYNLEKIVKESIEITGLKYEFLKGEFYFNKNFIVSNKNRIYLIDTNYYFLDILNDTNKIKDKSNTIAPFILLSGKVNETWENSYNPNFKEYDAYKSKILKNDTLQKLISIEMYLFSYDGFPYTSRIRCLVELSKDSGITYIKSEKYLSRLSITYYYSKKYSLINISN